MDGVLVFHDIVSAKYFCGFGISGLNYINMEIYRSDNSNMLRYIQVNSEYPQTKTKMFNPLMRSEGEGPKH